MIISRAEKVFYKLSHPFILKDPKKVGIKGMYLSIIKATYDKSTANVKINGEKV
jgi:hypothetical protein